MTSQDRHDLQQNLLATYLGRLNTQIEPYSKLIAVFAAVGIAGLAGWSLYSSGQANQRSDATLDLIMAGETTDAEALSEAAGRHAGAPAGAWLRLYEGDQFLADGINQLFQSREIAEEKLGLAQSAYREALSSTEDTLITSRAHFGLARAADSLGNVDEAIEAFEAVVEANESEAMVEHAQKRIETLSRDETRQFLGWFSEQDFSPADPDLPPALSGIESLPDVSDLDLPSLDSLTDQMGLGSDPEAPEETPESDSDTSSDQDSSEAVDDAAVEPADNSEAGDSPAEDAATGEAAQSDSADNS
ncbi:MAG: tetratricopeptide repeat protein [Planctomycetota bacterium]